MVMMFSTRCKNNKNIAGINNNEVISVCTPWHLSMGLEMGYLVEAGWLLSLYPVYRERDQLFDARRDEPALSQ